MLNANTLSLLEIVWTYFGIWPGSRSWDVPHHRPSLLLLFPQMFHLFWLQEPRTVSNDEQSKGNKQSLRGGRPLAPRWQTASKLRHHRQHQYTSSEPHHSNLHHIFHLILRRHIEALMPLHVQQNNNPKANADNGCSELIYICSRPYSLESDQIQCYPEVLAFSSQHI